MLVCPRNPPRGHTLAPTTDRTCFRDRLVHLATSASGYRANLTSQTQGATVVLDALVWCSGAIIFPALARHFRRHTWHGRSEMAGTLWVCTGAALRRKSRTMWPKTH